MSTGRQVDVCLIGGGIACLYAAYRLQRLRPGISIVVLEKDERLGGRAHTAVFHGVQIAEGAGIGRIKKDKLLLRLLQDLGLSYQAMQSTHNYVGLSPVDVKGIVRHLKRVAHKYDRHTTTFSAFARKELGPAIYAEFVRTCGFTDFEKADIIDTLYHYGFDDTLEGGIFSVPWNALVAALAQNVGKQNIVLNSPVTHIGTSSSYSNRPIVVTHRNGTVYCSKAVVGTTIETVRRLMPSVPLYKHISSQPFIRVYAKIHPNEKLAKQIPGYSVFGSGHLQKMIPMGRDVYMVAYADNRHATMLAPNAHSAAYLEHEIYKAAKVHVKVQDVYVKFWQHGTHFFTPLPKMFRTRSAFVKKCQTPQKNVYVIGEAVSLHNQGWTQGALESVEAVLLRI